MHTFTRHVMLFLRSEVQSSLLYASTVIHILFLVLCKRPVVVVDPFCGTGAVGAAALSMGSYFIGVDVDEGIVVLTFEHNVSHTRVHYFTLVCP